MRSAEIAAPLRSTHGPSARAEPRCSSRATSSLPVPDSPEISTGESLRATRSAIESTARMGACSVRIVSAPSSRARRAVIIACSRAIRRFSNARRTSTSISAIRYGFVR